MIDVKEQISEVRRTIGSRVLEAGEARVMTISQAYDTDVDDLWDVVTNPDRIPRWFLPISGELREGGKYQFEGNAGGTITTCDRPRRVAATWEFNGGISWVEVRISSESDSRARFELEHVAHVEDEHWEQYGPGAVGLGWDSAFWGLANHLTAPGAPITPEAAMEWMTSPDGVLFLRLSSDAWAEADIAFGTEPSRARTQAVNTFKAYTGA